MSTGTPTAHDLLTAELLMDRRWLGEQVGVSVRATRLRHKPGLSTTAALVADGGAGDGRPVGWVQCLLPGQRAKIDNAIRRAARRDLTVTVRAPQGPTGPHLVFGGPDTDPRLEPALRALGVEVPAVLVDGQVGPALERGSLEMLRYNPLRRMVLRSTAPGAGQAGASSVLRLTARPTAVPVGTLRELADQGVPVVQPTAFGGGDRLSHWPWAGDTDLARITDSALAAHAATAAGTALAALHAAAVTAPPPHVAPEHVLLRLAADLSRLDSRLGDRTEHLVLRAAVGAAATGGGVVHGDFSADQVVVDGTSVRLLDFDRLARGNPADDLGSFLATQYLAGVGLAGAVTSALVQGYLGAGGRSGGTGAVRTGIVVALLRRVLDPFRDARPDWRWQVGSRLDTVAALLDGAHDQQIARLLGGPAGSVRPIGQLS